MHLATKVYRPGVTCRSGYVGNPTDRVSHRVIDKRVCRVGQNTAGNISATTSLNQTADGGGWQVAQRYWQHSTLLHPPRRITRKLPNLTGPNAIRNINATQNDQRVIEHTEATGQSARVPWRPVT